MKTLVLFLLLFSGVSLFSQSFEIERVTPKIDRFISVDSLNHQWTIGYFVQMRKEKRLYSFNSEGLLMPQEYRISNDTIYRKKYPVGIININKQVSWMK